MAQALIIVLRVLHIAAGVLWAGGAFMMAGFIFPASKMAGPEGGKFLQILMQRARLPLFLSWAGWISTGAGLVLYWHSSGGLQHEWMRSGMGVGFTLGALAGLAAFLIGQLVNIPAAARLGAAGRAVQQAGGPPSPQQAAEIGALQDRIRHGTHLIAALLAVSVVFMALARRL
jgi:hypothetical protein